MKNRPVSRSPNCWLSVMLPPCLASSPDTAATIPGRSGQERVSTNSGISVALQGERGAQQVSAWHGGHPEVVEINVALSLPRDAASVAVGRQVLSGCLEVLGATPATRGDIALALGEACANVIQHAGPGDEYEVRARAIDGRCVIEVINTGSDADQIELDGSPAPLTAERGRGLQIMDAVVDRLSLTGDDHSTMTVHFEKVLEWLPDAPGQLLVAGSSEKAR
jgi:serine/threonine-protein kinase RsbW